MSTTAELSNKDLSKLNEECGHHCGTSNSTVRGDQNKLKETSIIEITDETVVPVNTLNGRLISTLTVDELKLELDKLGLKKNGKKSELAKRLQIAIAKQSSNNGPQEPGVVNRYKSISEINRYQSISIADCHRLILVIDNNRTHRKKIIDCYRLAKIDNNR